MSPLKAYHHVSLSVTDLGKSTAWYRDVFGFELDADIEGASFRRTRLRMPGSGVTLTLTSHDGESGEAFSERRPGLDHLAFEVAGADDITSLKARFEELGVDHSEIKESESGSAMITLRDPDNIQLEVFKGPVDPATSARGPGG